MWTWMKYLRKKFNMKKEVLRLTEDWIVLTNVIFLKNRPNKIEHCLYNNFIAYTGFHSIAPGPG